MPQLISPEMTYNYAPTAVPPHILDLKVGVPVMVIRNVLHKQFPVLLAFSETMRKAQRTTSSKLVADLRTNFFASGQLYDTLSRTCRDSDVVLLKNSEHTTPSSLVLNFYTKCLFQSLIQCCSR